MNKDLKIGISLVVTSFVLLAIIGFVAKSIFGMNVGDPNVLNSPAVVAKRIEMGNKNTMKAWDTVGKGVTGVGIAVNNVARPMGKWIAFFVAIMLAMSFLFGYGTYRIVKSTRRSAAYSNQNTSRGGFIDRVSNGLRKFSNPFGKKAYNATAREEETSGRCDNSKWLSIEDNKKKITLCLDASFQKPDPVRFTIDPTTIYNFDKLPNAIKTKIREDSGKLSITVPYTYNQKPSAYVLNFQDAVFEDGTSAGHLFNKNFNFDYWNFESKYLNQTGNKGKSYKYTYRYRPPTSSNEYKGLDVYK